MTPHLTLAPTPYLRRAQAFRQHRLAIVAAKSPILADRINRSQELMREKHADYDEAEERFVELAKADPSLVRKMRDSGLPAKFVYDHVKKHQQLQEMQGMNGRKARLNAESAADRGSTFASIRCAIDGRQQHIIHAVRGGHFLDASRRVQVYR